ncbi:MAG TPA: hypothetical protein VL979_07795 [Solirubrobacteraceae bacterium]|nr:hypothetical protein [Solirubrobacteraceae bacterium]
MASETISCADIEAMPFGEAAELPQPASATAARTNAARNERAGGRIEGIRTARRAAIARP